MAIVKRYRPLARDAAAAGWQMWALEWAPGLEQ